MSSNQEKINQLLARIERNKTIVARLTIEIDTLTAEVISGQKPKSAKEDVRNKRMDRMEHNDLISELKKEVRELQLTSSPPAKRFKPT